jgi:hypothetical protein
MPLVVERLYLIDIDLSIHDPLVSVVSMARILRS